MKFLNILKYMLPGIAAGIITAIYFASGSSMIITVILFCVLITYAIVSSNEISSLKDKLEDQVTQLEFDLKSESVEERLDNLNDKINFVAQAASSEIDDLANNVGSEIHEIALMIADKRFGPEDGEDA